MPEWIDKATEDGCHYWSYRLGAVEITLEKRPDYCDRGHWWAHCWSLRTLQGFASLDSADCWPRFYMDLERAKLELAEWLDWRVRAEGVCWL